MAISVQTFGDRIFSYRLPSALAGAGVGTLLFLCSIGLTGSLGAGLFSVWLWLSSPLAYLHARLATLDMMTAFFFLGGLAAFLPVLKDPKSKYRDVWLGLACLAAALGGAVKVIDYLLFPLFLMGLGANRHHWPLKQSLPRLFAWSLVFIPGVLIFSYGLLGFVPSEIPTQILNIYRLQSKLHPDYAGLSPWYDWFLFQGGLWYRSAIGENEKQFAALCINNPVLWITGSLSCLWLFGKALRKKDGAAYVLAWAVPLQILFWILFKKQTILSYALPMVPVFCLASGWAVEELTRHAKDPGLAKTLWILCLGTASTLFFWIQWPRVYGFFTG